MRVEPLLCAGRDVKTALPRRLFHHLAAHQQMLFIGLSYVRCSAQLHPRPVRERSGSDDRAETLCLPGREDKLELNCLTAEFCIAFAVP